MAFRLLKDVKVTGASSSLHLHEKCDKHTVEGSWVDGNGTVTAMTVSLQATAQPRSVSDALASWYDLQSYALVAGDITNKNFIFHVVNKTVQRVRVNITTLTGAGSTTKVQVRYIPKVDV